MLHRKFLQVSHWVIKTNSPNDTSEYREPGQVKRMPLWRMMNSRAFANGTHGKERSNESSTGTASRIQVTERLCVCVCVSIWVVVCVWMCERDREEEGKTERRVRESRRESLKDGGREESESNAMDAAWEAIRICCWIQLGFCKFFLAFYYFINLYVFYYVFLFYITLLDFTKGY